MYYNDDFRHGYYCDVCDDACCLSHFILCDPCMQKLTSSEFMFNAEVYRLKKEIEDLKVQIEELKMERDKLKNKN